MIQRFPAPDDAEEGFSLIELLVSMLLFAGLLAIFGTSISIMFRDVRQQLGRSDDLDADRRVLSQLDRQVRYANAINTPGTTGSAPSLTYWVEWQSGNLDQQQTCTQWRLLPTGQMQYRTWSAPFGTQNNRTNLTGWSTRASNVVLQLAGASVVPPFAFPAATTTINNTRQQLVVTFASTYGAPKVTTPSQVTLTALNTYASDALLNAVCQPDVMRS